MQRDWLQAEDLAIFNLIEEETKRQEEHLELIASENFVSKAVMEAMGSSLTNKYAEGYPGARYYGGCEVVDEVERIAIDRLKKLFKADHANVQPHSGSNANMAVFLACLKPGDRVLSMELTQGGHLSHGSKANISGKYFEFHHYGLDPETEQIDYDEVMKIAREVKPKLIIAGASAYARSIDFSKFRVIADEVDALLLVDMAHIAGLVAAGVHQSPVPYADFVTSTTHKTMRGPRGAFILCPQKWQKKIDSAVFPGLQGGPLMHVIAAKAVSFGEALTDEFVDYQKQVVENAKVMSQVFDEEKIRMISKGTDNHLILLDVSSIGCTGKEAESLLGEANITSNKNSIPNDPLGVRVTSGIRLGTPAITSRGMKANEARLIATLISDVLKKRRSVEDVKKDVLDLCERFPLYRDKE